MRINSIAARTSSSIKDADRGVLTAIVTSKREQLPPDVGVSTAQVLCNDDRILSVGLKTVHQLISRGIFELELLTDRHRLLAIDLNPRAFGFIMLDIAIGNDLPWHTTFGAVDPCRIPRRLPETESRLAVPYYFAQWVRFLLGPRGGRTRSGAGVCDVQWISMFGHRSDPLPMLLAHLRLLRLLPHRGGMLMHFIARAWHSWRTVGEPQ